MILFDKENLSPVRRRTLERITHSALKLYREKNFRLLKRLLMKLNMRRSRCAATFQPTVILSSML